MDNIIFSNIAYPISTDKRLSSDVEAVLQWLRARGNRSQHTFDAYKREAEKFLTWVFNQKRIKKSDCYGYYAIPFLSGKPRNSQAKHNQL